MMVKKRANYRRTLHWKAATALDLTWHTGNRSARLANARDRVATWLDTGKRYATLRKDIAYLEGVAKKWGRV